MDHLPAEEARAELAEGAHPDAGRERLHLALPELEEAEDHLSGVVGYAADELPLRAVDDVGGADDALDLHGCTGRRARDGRDARLVLVAQRQVQDEIEAASQPELVEP